MSNTAPSRADPVVVFPFGRWCPPQETSQPHPPQQQRPVGYTFLYKMANFHGVYLKFDCIDSANFSYDIVKSVFLTVIKSWNDTKSHCSVTAELKYMQFCNEQTRSQPLFSPACPSATYGSARMCRRKNKVWDEMAYPFSNFHSVAVEVGEWISNSISYFTGRMIHCNDHNNTHWPHGPLARYVKLRVTHELGMPGTFSLTPTSKETAS